MNQLIQNSNFMIMIILLLTAVQSHAQLLSTPNSQKHSTACFTQGLIIEDNIVWESCGGFGVSQLKKWNLLTGKVISRNRLDKNYFAEGLTEINGDLYVLTWQSKTAFKVDKETLEITKTFHYKGEGWGLTQDGKYLIMSNGSNVLQFINPESFKVVKSIKVTLNGSDIHYLNELEWIDGKIWANVYQTDYIVEIDPITGNVVNKHHLPNLLKGNIKKPGVLNGIAHDKVSQKTWVTGKKWPLMFEL